MKDFIELKNYYPVAGGKLTPYTIDCPTGGNETKWLRPAVIVVPGGAYEHVSKRESAPVACKFLALGFQTFVLEYLTVRDGVRYPEQLNSLAAAVNYVKKHAKVYHINADEIFLIGFSAGGHLAANLATSGQTDFCRALDCSVRAIALGYPVISAKYGHTRSFDNLLFGYDEQKKQELIKLLALDEAVSKSTPPTFIWTTASDSTVPALNSLKYATALAQNGVKYELHIYPETDHGSSTCDFEVNGENAAYRKNSHWISDCAEFFRLFTVEKY